MSLSVNQRCSPFAALNPVPAQSVILTKGFWQARQRALFQDGLLAQHAHCERTGRLDNFRRAAGAHKGPYQGLLFNDSDVHKWLEAGYWALGSGQAHPDLERQVQAVTELVLAAQEPDGYLNTHFYDEMAEHKWTNLDDWHELYCAGHFIQAALAAHHNGHPRLLNAAVRLADLICETFGPTSTGQRPGIPGHQGIEIALIELYRLTANKTYLEQAQYFIDERGQGLLGKRSYNQNDKPIREQEQLVGHAVRALYLNIAAADLYAETGDPELKTALERLWVHLNQYQLYVTGGIGSRHASESMGSNYELPNDRAYAETCAAVANVIWNQRMLLIDGERCYADMLELSLFNGALAGISLDTDSYFYVNPLAAEADQRRSGWFACACCPPNIARLIASITGYFFNQDAEGLWIQLYSSCDLDLELLNGQRLLLQQATNYPWSGTVDLTFDSAVDMTLRLRVPGWVTGRPSLQLNGQPLVTETNPEGYIVIQRQWATGDRLELELPMAPQFLTADLHVTSNSGQLALRCGPLIYCLEACDQPTLDLDLVAVDSAEAPQPETLAALPGLTALSLAAWEIEPLDKSLASGMYHPKQIERRAQPLSKRLLAIPYFAWANRAPGAMRVWMKAG